MLGSMGLAVPDRPRRRARAARARCLRARRRRLAPHAARRARHRRSERAEEPRHRRLRQRHVPDHRQAEVADRRARWTWSRWRKAPDSSKANGPRTRRISRPGRARARAAPAPGSSARASTPRSPPASPSAIRRRSAGASWPASRPKLEDPGRASSAPGPPGCCSAQLLHRQRHRERRARAAAAATTCSARIRAGVLEQGTVDLLREAGLAERLDARRPGARRRRARVGGATASGSICTPDRRQAVMVYGQTELTRDLMERATRAALPIVFEARGRQRCTTSTAISRTSLGARTASSSALDCDFIAGCDGFHGVSRASVPAERAARFERVYPFGWLGILADVPPLRDELIYCQSRARLRARLACARRRAAATTSRCRSTTSIEDWPDDALLGRAQARVSAAKRPSASSPGPSIEKSIAPLRSFVAEPMRHGRLFLAGDAAHIVPPTGAKGLNLAASDVHYLCARSSSTTETGRSGAARRLQRNGAAPRLGIGARLVVPDDAAASSSRREPFDGARRNTSSSTCSPPRTPRWHSRSSTPACRFRIHACSRP